MIFFPDNSDGMTDHYEPDDCPIISSGTERFLAQFAFWTEGALGVAVATAGVTSNSLFSYLLMRRELRNSFNCLLIVLAAFDSVYLFMATLESLRKVSSKTMSVFKRFSSQFFGVYATLQIKLFPHLLYPLQAIALTGSIFMTVAIAFERYALHNTREIKIVMQMDERVVYSGKNNGFIIQRKKAKGAHFFIPSLG